MSMAEKKATGKKQEKADISINFNLPIEMSSVYATNMLVQAGEDEVTLSFFEAQPPLLQGTPEENLAILKAQGVRADCVARVTISKNRFGNFVNAMKQIQDQLTELNKKVK